MLSPRGDVSIGKGPAEPRAPANPPNQLQSAFGRRAEPGVRPRRVKEPEVLFGKTQFLGCTPGRQSAAVAALESSVRVVGLAPSWRLSLTGPPRRFVTVTQSAEELVERGTQGMSKGVPRLWGADGATLLDLDKRPSGQAALGRELVVSPPPRGPQPGEFRAQSLEIRVGREDRHPTIRRCRHLPCQCRPLPCLCPQSAHGGAEVCTTVCRRPQPDGGRRGKRTDSRMNLGSAYTRERSDAARRPASK